MWQQSGPSKPMNWNDSQNFINRLNRDYHAGYSDWRLPTIAELKLLQESIQEAGNLSIDSTFGITQTRYWSSDKDERSSRIRYIYFVNNSTELASLDELHYVRAVRSVELGSETIDRFQCDQCPRSLKSLLKLGVIKPFIGFVYRHRRLIIDDE